MLIGQPVRHADNGWAGVVDGVPAADEVLVAWADGDGWVDLPPSDGPVRADGDTRVVVAVRLRIDDTHRALRDLLDHVVAACDAALARRLPGDRAAHPAFTDAAVVEVP